MVSKLHEVLKPFLLRRVKEDVEKAIPAKQEITLYAPLTETQRKLQDSIMQRTIVKDMDELAQSNGVKRAHQTMYPLVQSGACGEQQRVSRHTSPVPASRNHASCTTCVPRCLLERSACSALVTACGQAK